MSKNKTQQTTDFLIDSAKMFFDSIVFTASMFSTKKDIEVKADETIKEA